MRIRRPNAAEALAITALVVASSGSAVAASRYVITSSAQIKPSVLRQIAHATRGETAEPSSLWAFNKPGIPVDPAYVNCPRGFEEVTGGYSANLPPGWQIMTEARSTSSYRVVAVSSDPHPTQQAKLKVTAYCRSAP
jgi:hypothetical protein